MKHIKAVGFDMDHTIVRYNSRLFEETTFNEVIKKLLTVKHYPAEISKLRFDFDLAIRGLAIDKKNGNLLKVSRFGQIKSASHGSKILDYKTVREYYKGRYIDLNDPAYICIDTTFSISHAVLFALLIDLKDQKTNLPSYEIIATDVLEMIDMCHRDGTLKNIVRENIADYILKDPAIVNMLMRLKKFGKKIWVITNSHYAYTKLLLDYTINPYLRDFSKWEDFFDLVVVSSSKPRFFMEDQPFFKVNTQDESLTEVPHVVGGIYHGGSATRLQTDMNLKPDEILYLGDHIYGDIVSLKKSCYWRTALVLEELEQETIIHKRHEDLEKCIDESMQKKVALEKKLDDLQEINLEKNMNYHSEETQQILNEIENLNLTLGNLIETYNQNFNPYWGEVMRAGREESRFANQVEKYACFYVSKVSDLLECSPRSYLRPVKRMMAHDSYSSLK